MVYKLLQSLEGLLYKKSAYNQNSAFYNKIDF